MSDVSKLNSTTLISQIVYVFWKHKIAQLGICKKRKT